MSELSDKAIEQLQQAVAVEILTDKAGNEYMTRQVFPVQERVLPFPGCLKIATLTGLVDFCLNNKCAGPEDPAIIHIIDHAHVRVLSKPFGPAKQVTQFVEASFIELLGMTMKFGMFYDHESFIVGLQSLFEPTPARDEVLKVIGSIKENQVREFGDDGVSQSVSAKAGIALVSEVKVPNPVKLSPFRTFLEITQPESPFILRVKPGENGRPACALFEADGGRWKLIAIQLIKDYLEDKLDLPIIA